MREAEEMVFEDRADAGRRLACRLVEYANRDDVLVLGIPRGGVLVAFEIAAALRAPLDVLVSCKLGLPGEEELAFGAIASGGVRIFDGELIEAVRLAHADVEWIIANVRKELERRETRYRGDRQPLFVQGKTVILVDDGIATGSSMRAAIAALRQMKPARVLVAVPVAPLDTYNALRSEVDELICSYKPESFYAIGQFYDDFSQVTDEEVAKSLQRIARVQAANGRERCMPASETRAASAVAGWEHYSHGADIGVRGFGISVEEAFEQAAIALTAVVAEVSGVRPSVQTDIRCQAPDLELLFVSWLNKIVYEMATRNMLFSSYRVALSGFSLTGVLRGEVIDPMRHQLAVEVKGATVTDLKVECDREGRWRAQCIVDV